jgi:anti-sigma factor RsiW
MMTCREFVEVLLEFVCGELPPDHHDRAKEHLSSCPDCVAYKATYELTIVLVRKLSCDPLPKSCEQRLRANLEKELGGSLDSTTLA